MTGTKSVNFEAWTKATGDLPWGVQRTLYEALGAVANSGIKMCYGANWYDGAPCLVNAVANMISADPAKVTPAQWFPHVVREFDMVNEALSMAGVNKYDNIVTPLAAEVLMANFGPLKPPPTEDDWQEAALEVLNSAPYVEPSDEEMAKAWAEAINHPSVGLEPREDEPVADTTFPLSNVVSIHHNSR